MTKYDFYDTAGKLRSIETSTPVELNTMRTYISEFRTHCIVEGSQYEFNHFGNWLKKYKGISIVFSNPIVYRVDM